MANLILLILGLSLFPIFFDPMIGIIGGFKGFLIQLLSPFVHRFTISLIFCIIGIKIILIIKKFIFR